MIYRSNLTCPDLTGFFGHLNVRRMPHSLGHSMISDWADMPAVDERWKNLKNCGFWSHDEVAILYNCARQFPGQRWLDIGAHTGWTAAHAAVAGTKVIAVDSMFDDPQLLARFEENTALWYASGEIDYCPVTSGEFFSSLKRENIFAGVVIDGNHDRPFPYEDARNAAAHLAPNGCILLHDFAGAPIQEATVWLMNHGFKCRVYWTPNMVACCWRGEFVPPDHQRDPEIDWAEIQARISFPFGRTE